MSSAQAIVQTRRLLNFQTPLNKTAALTQLFNCFIMSVLYRVYEDTREESLTHGQFFGRAVHTGTVELEQLGAEIEENVSVKYSDVMGVLIELVNVMNKHLHSSERVKLNGFGSFKIGLRTKGALREEDFSATKNIVGARVNFYPDYKVETGTGKRNVKFLAGVTVKNVKEILPKPSDGEQEP